jgi:hypothetical protein
MFILLSVMFIFIGFEGKKIDVSTGYGAGTFEMEPWQSLLAGICSLIGGLYLAIDFNKKK